MITCPNCSSENLPGAVFCDNCGHDLRSTPPIAPQSSGTAAGTISCSNCGHANVAGSAFCENCGTPLSGQAPPVSQPPLPTPAGAASYTGGVTCQNCHYQNTAGSSFCENCGAQLGGQSAMPGPVQPTYQPTPPQPVQPVAAPRLLTGYFVIQGINTTLPLPQNKTEALIGREDPVSSNFPDIDLDPFQGMDKGVGRQHARVYIRGGQLMIEDLDSVNGTTVNKQKLVAKQPHPLNNGDEVRFGQLIVQYFVS